MEVLVTILKSLGFDGITTLILIISIFVDISPLKVNPIKAIFNYLGKHFNNSIQREISGFKEEVNEKFEKLQNEQSEQRKTLNKLLMEQDNKEISKLRWDIIEFESSILNNMRHHREEYRHIIDCANKYMRIVRNNENISVPEEDIIKIKESADFIKNHYERHRLNQTNIFF